LKPTFKELEIIGCGYAAVRRTTLTQLIRLYSANSVVVRQTLEPRCREKLGTTLHRPAIQKKCLLTEGHVRGRLFLLAVLLNAVNLFLQVFFTIMYSDLECDYINPIDLCNRLNMYIIPEAGVHAFLTALFLINGYWLPLILNLPLVAWNAKK